MLSKLFHIPAVLSRIIHYTWLTREITSSSLIIPFKISSHLTVFMTSTKRKNISLIRFNKVMHIIWIIFQFISIFWITAISKNLIEVWGTKFTWVYSFYVPSEILFLCVGVGITVGT